MIMEGIFDLILAPLTLVLELLPDISWTVSAEGFTVLFEFFRVVCYLLPMRTVVGILSVIVLINGFKIVVSIIKTVWQLLPFL